MGDSQNERTKHQRTLRRCCEASRLEVDLWNRVFEELWPVALRSTRRRTTSEVSGDLDWRTKQSRGA